MILEATIAQAVRAIVREARPLRVVLFGSYARGDAGPDSDLDFLVVKLDVINELREASEVRQALRSLRVPADVIVVSESKLDDLGRLPGSVYHEALNEGRVLFDNAA